MDFINILTQNQEGLSFNLDPEAFPDEADILSENEVMAVTKNGDISFITDKGRVDGIINSIKEEADNEVRAVNAKEELSRVEEQQHKLADIMEVSYFAS